MHRNEMSLGTGGGVRIACCSSLRCGPAAGMLDQKCTSLTSVGVAALLCALPCIGGGVHASRCWPFGAAHPRSAIIVFTISSICSRHVWRQSCREKLRLEVNSLSKLGSNMWQMFVESLQTCSYLPNQCAWVRVIAANGRPNLSPSEPPRCCKTPACLQNTVWTHNLEQRRRFYRTGENITTCNLLKHFLIIFGVVFMRKVDLLRNLILWWSSLEVWTKLLKLHKESIKVILLLIFVGYPGYMYLMPYGFWVFVLHAQQTVNRRTNHAASHPELTGMAC